MHHFHSGSANIYSILLKTIKELTIPEHNERRLQILITTNNVKAKWSFRSNRNDFNSFLFDYGTVMQNNAIVQSYFEELADAGTVVCLHSELFRLGK